MSDKYILNGHRPVPCEDLMTWAKWFGTADRTVAKTLIDGVEVSTVFLGLDHRFSNGPPLLFETVVFGPENEECDRYSTWEEAEAGHREMCRMVSAVCDHRKELRCQTDHRRCGSSG